VIRLWDENAHEERLRAASVRQRLQDAL